jgi:hypothetical protein
METAFTGSRDTFFYKEPSRSILHILTGILFEFIPILLREWTEISAYIEQFVASKLSFLNEK